MRIISDIELAMVGGGDLEADIQAMIDGAVNMNNTWVDNLKIEIMKPLFTVFGIEVTYTGSPLEGLKTAGMDCLGGGGIVKMGNDAAIVAGYTLISSSGAAILGCTAGVGGGIIRDLLE